MQGLLNRLISSHMDFAQRKEWQEAWAQLVTACLAELQKQGSSSSSSTPETTGALQAQLEAVQLQLKRGIPSTSLADPLAVEMRQLFGEIWALQEPQACAVAAQCQAADWDWYARQLQDAAVVAERLEQLQGEMEEVRAGAEAASAAAAVLEREKGILVQQVRRLEGVVADLEPWKKLTDKVANGWAGGEGKKWLAQQQLRQQQLASAGCSKAIEAPGARKEVKGQGCGMGSASTIDEEIRELMALLAEMEDHTMSTPEGRESQEEFELAWEHQEQRLRMEGDNSSSNCNISGTLSGCSSSKGGCCSSSSSIAGTCSSSMGSRSASWSSADGAVFCSISLGGGLQLEGIKAV
jgi:hypothetical protein